MSKTKKQMKMGFENDAAAFKQSIKDLKKELQLQCPYSPDTKDGLLSNADAFALLEKYDNLIKDFQISNRGPMQSIEVVRIALAARVHLSDLGRYEPQPRIWA